MSAPLHLRGRTTHARRGALAHAFSYSVDYVLIDPEAQDTGALLFSRNRLNLTSVHDRDHGGRRDAGAGAAWAHHILAERGIGRGPDSRLLLLTQPRFLGYAFNPVSFWLRFEGDDLVAVIAEVNNTYGDRHNYLCHLPGFAPLSPADTIDAQKVFHVSPFQDVAGDYRFGFKVTTDRIAIRIAHRNKSEGLHATLSGALAPLTSRAILTSTLRRPFGPLRTVALIYWHALRLWLKGAVFRNRPEPPQQEVSS